MTRALLVMPMCHANSLYFFGAFTYCGAACTVYSRKSFDPEHLVRTLADGGSTFTSLVPTHYIMMLGLSAAVREPLQRRRGHQADDLVGAGAPRHQARHHGLLQELRACSSFTARPRRAGSPCCTPNEQFAKLGSVGRECVGSRPIRLLDPAGNDVPDGETGELYSCNPHTFDGYWKLPDKTADAFRGAIARSATSPGATRTATFFWSTARAT